MIGLFLTRWTIRLALLCYVVCLAAWIRGADRGPRAAVRWLWTLGCVLFIAHVACAFQFVHHWSHRAAGEATAAETDALLGVRFGAGLYFNYLFLLLWALDVAAAWLVPVWGGTTPLPPIGAWEQPSARPMVAALQAERTQPVAAAVRWAIHGYLFFIAFNGAVVFATGPTRWAGIAACVALGGLAAPTAYNGWRRQRGVRNSERRTGNCEG